MGQSERMRKVPQRAPRTTLPPRGCTPPNLLLKHRTWCVAIRVPKDLVPLVGKARLVRSTGEHDIHRAAIKAEPIRREFQAILSEARKGMAQGDLEARIRALTVAYRDAKAHPFDMSDEVLEQAVHTVLNGFAPEELQEPQRTPEAQAAQKTLARIVGASTPFLEVLEAWKAATHIKDRQQDQYVADMTMWAKAYPTTQEATREAAQDWVDARLKLGDSPKTLQRRMAALRTYWKHMRPREATPWDGVVVPKPRAVIKAEREAFSVPEVLALVSAAGRSQKASVAGAAGKGAMPFRDLIVLGAMTGGRIEELCTATVADLRDNGKAIRLASKTKAGHRTVPLVGVALGLVQRLAKASQGPEGYLIHSTADNQYGERSGPLGQKFGRLKASMGHGPTLVFHSLRKTVASLLRDAGCPEPIAAGILGHEIATMSYGLYATTVDPEVARTWLTTALASLDGGLARLLVDR